MAVPNRIRFRAEDIWDTPDDGNRYEVIDGELYVSPPPSFDHQLAVSELFLQLGVHIKSHRLGTLLPAPLGVILGVGAGVQPDLVYISQQRSNIIMPRGIEGAPDLVIEVLSPSTMNRDRGVKMTQFAQAGIPHYWIVDPRSHRLEAYQLTDEGYSLVVNLGAADVFLPVLFPGFELKLSELWG
ncbi:MAG: Uma2 family endonuclease [Chloroflexota bacterium]